VLIALGGREVPIDATEKRRAELLNERLGAIVESSDDIIASKDLDGVLTSWNKRAERILGYTAEEVIGRHVSMLMPPELIEDMLAIEHVQPDSAMTLLELGADPTICDNEGRTPVQLVRESVRLYPGMPELVRRIGQTRGA
jgi:PAS domain-containing protein